MDMKQLKYFYTIACEGQVTKAAKKLHMAQPPLSQQLKLLEQELGVTLFERHRRTMTLTQAGEVLFTKAERLLQEMEEIRMEVRDRGEGLSGTLAIGTVKSCFAYLPAQMQQFRTQYPNVRFSLHDGDSYRISELVKNRTVELGLVRLPLPLSEFAHIRLPDEPFVVVFPAGWRLPQSGNSLSMADLREVPLLLLHRVHGTGQYEMVLDACRAHQFEPNVVCECPDVTLLLALVANGVGATIVPKSTLETFRPPGVEVFSLVDTTLEAKAAIIWLSGWYLSKQARRLIARFGEDVSV
ncbi:LysR family transcriptional regulator [Bacillus sp. FSL W7-1360]